MTDLASTNGTFINGITILDATCGGGEQVQLGETTIRLDLLAGVAKVQLPTATRFGRLVGQSVEMRKLYPLCERLAASTVPVIIEGETGTGKEVLAESLHEMSPRSSGPFVVFDCTAVPPTWSSRRSSATSAAPTPARPRAAAASSEEAHGGTLLLDELGDLELSLQAKLLRVLERSEVQRVGSNRWIKVDTRVLAATRRDLDHEIQAGRFRDDLFFRLAVARIELPPLRRRDGDVTVLAFHFWRHLAGKTAPFPSDFAQRLESYAWPGNVRELYNAVARRVALGDLAAVETARSGPSEATPPPTPSSPRQPRGAT